MTHKRPGEVDVLVGARLRLRRIALGISQACLAEGMGITFQQVQKYEKGVNRISASRLQAAADMLAVPIIHFFEQESPSPAGGYGFPTTIASSREAVELTRQFIRIGDGALRRAVLALVEAVSAASGTDAAGLQGRSQRGAAPPTGVGVGER